MYCEDIIIIIANCFAINNNYIGCQFITGDASGNFAIYVFNWSVGNNCKTFVLLNINHVKNTKIFGTLKAVYESKMYIIF